MSHISIKPVLVSDIALLSKIAQQAYLDHYRPLWQDEGAWYVSKVYNQTQLLSEIGDENVAYFFVFQDETLVGFIKLKTDYPLSIGASGLPFGYGEGSAIALDNALYLERIYFIKSATGKGLGSFCFYFIENYALEKGKTIIWLMAMDWSIEALNFYKKQGFTQCGTWQLDFEMLKKDHCGMVILTKELKNIKKPELYETARVVVERT
jgi:diamine N-acetyltransferase